MDITRVGGVDPYHGGTSQQRPGTGAFAQHKKDEEERRRREAETTAEAAAPEVDPLLAEIDRLRALDPNLTESGTHRAMLAARAYQTGPPPAVPEELVPTEAAPPPPVETPPEPAVTASTRAFARTRAPTPPATGGEASGR